MTVTLAAYNDLVLGPNAGHGGYRHGSAVASRRRGDRFGSDSTILRAVARNSPRCVTAQLRFAVATILILSLRRTPPPPTFPTQSSSERTRKLKVGWQPGATSYRLHDPRVTNWLCGRSGRGGPYESALRLKCGNLVDRAISAFVRTADLTPRSGALANVPQRELDAGIVAHSTAPALRRPSSR